MRRDSLEPGTAIKAMVDTFINSEFMEKHDTLVDTWFINSEFMDNMTNDP